MATVLEYMHAAMRHANYERCEDGSIFATIPGFRGLWAQGATVEDAREDLYSALDGWISVEVLVAQNHLPEIDGVSPYHVSKAED
ncbi:MAG: type II toxin-antitoxin system HicB family antitoxin [Candidatus Binataceae bacterium]